MRISAPSLTSGSPTPPPQQSTYAFLFSEPASVKENGNNTCVRTKRSCPKYRLHILLPALKSHDSSVQLWPLLNSQLPVRLKVEEQARSAEHTEQHRVKRPDRNSQLQGA